MIFKRALLNILISLLPIGAICFPMHTGEAKKLINPLQPLLSGKRNINVEKFVSCGKPPKALKHMFGVTFYTDKNHSIVDEEKRRKNAEAFLPLAEYKQAIAKMADAYFVNTSLEPSPAKCVLDWLYEYASQKALLGKSNPQGNNEIKWTLGSLAMSYLQVKEEPSLDSKRKRKVEKWLKKLAQTVKSREGNVQNQPKNNHAYWMGLALISTGIAVQDLSLYKSGLEKFYLFLKQIKEDGTLPLEAARGRKALSYHSFSAIPLFLIAELAFANGDDFFKSNNALYKLGDRVFDGFNSTEYFKTLTGTEQEKLKPDGLAFIEIYVLHNAKEEHEKFLKENRPLKSSILKKDFSLLFGKGL